MEHIWPRTELGGLPWSLLPTFPHCQRHAFPQEGDRDNTNLPQNLSRSPSQARENPEHGKSSSAHPQSCPVLKSVWSGSLTLKCSLKLVQYKTQRGVRACCVCMDVEAGYGLSCHSSGAASVLRYWTFFKKNAGRSVNSRTLPVSASSAICGDHNIYHYTQPCCLLAFFCLSFPSSGLPFYFHQIHRVGEENS